MTELPLIDFREHVELTDLPPNLVSLSQYIEFGLLNTPGMYKNLGEERQNPRVITLGSFTHSGPLAKPIDLLRESLRGYLEANTRPALLVSGGVDSNLVLQLLSEVGCNLDKDVFLIHGRFADTKYQELNGSLKQFRPYLNVFDLRVNSEHLESREFQQFVRSCRQPVNGLIAYLIYNLFLECKKIGITNIIVPTLDVVFLQSERQLRPEQMLAENLYPTAGDGSILSPRSFFVSDLYLGRIAVDSTEIYNLFYGDHKDMRNQYLFSVEPQLMTRRYPFVEFSHLANALGLDLWSPYNSMSLLRSIWNHTNIEMVWESSGKHLLKSYLQGIYSDFQPVSKVVTSPQREVLFDFGDRLKIRAEESILTSQGVLNKNVIVEAIDQYVTKVKSIGRDNLDISFNSLSSLNLWRFFISDLWVTQKLEGWNAKP